MLYCPGLNQSFRDSVRAKLSLFVQCFRFYYNGVLCSGSTSLYRSLVRILLKRKILSFWVKESLEFYSVVFKGEDLKKVKGLGEKCI